MLEIIGLSCSAGEQPIFKDLSFVLPEGKVLGVLGPSGSGKTSLLRLIMGFEAPDGGSIKWLGRPLSATGTVIVPPEKRGFGMVFQDSALFPHLTVRENVCFGLSRLPRNDRKAAAASWAKRCAIAGIMDRHIQELSGGESQRTALARALAPEPRLLLLDEPFSSVDRLVRRDLIETLGTVVKESGATIVLVTHDARDVLDFSTHLLLLKDGRMLCFGETSTILDKPGSDWAQAYLSEGLGLAQSNRSDI